jgi:hypothetical protein
MGRESIKVEIETITGEERDAARCQGLSQEVNNQVCRMLCTGTQLEHRKKLCAGVDGQPEPEHLCGTAQPGAQFVQLKMREPEVVKEALV